jgi:tripartite-type tricarboxylate transporter receptor subunit TctC
MNAVTLRRLGGGHGERRMVFALPLFLAVMAGLVAVLGPGTSRAQAPGYPAKQVHIILSYPPGGITDLLARTVAQAMQEQSGQPVVVDNRPGGNFVIAAEVAAHAPADGHTILLGTDSIFTVNPLGRTRLGYDADRDFAPISLAVLQTLFIVASGKAPAKTLPDMIRYARAHPGELSFGTTAFVAQLVGEQMKQLTGTDIQSIPFKGSPPMLQALLNGDIAFSIATFTPYASYTRDGRLVGLAVSGTRREPLVPEVPTLDELGIGEVAFHLWYGFFVPAATPPAVQAQVLAEMRRVMNDPVVRKKLLDAGMEPAPDSPAELAERIRADRAKWARVIRGARIELN